MRAVRIGCIRFVTTHPEGTDISVGVSIDECNDQMRCMHFVMTGSGVIPVGEIMLLHKTHLWGTSEHTYRTVSCIRRTFLPQNQASKEGVCLIHEYIQIFEIQREK